MRRALLQEGHFNSYSTELLNLNPFISLLRQNRLALFHRMITFTNCECKIFLAGFGIEIGALKQDSLSALLVMHLVCF